MSNNERKHMTNKILKNCDPFTSLMIISGPNCPPPVNPVNLFNHFKLFNPVNQFNPVNLFNPLSPVNPFHYDKSVNPLTLLPH